MTDDPLFSEHWYRVRHLKPRLASDVTVRRQRYRGLTAWVLHRASTRTYHHLENAAWTILSRLDGEHSVEELWQFALERFGESAPSQGTMIELLAQLHEAELLVVNGRLSAERLFERSQETTAKDRRQRYLNPLYARFALCDPERLLKRLQPFARGLFSRTTAALLVLLLIAALFLIAPHGTTLLDEVQGMALFSASQALAFFLVYPALKLIHELAHALAIKRCGGEVHEMGIALMVLLPLPYVDASEANLFTDKYDRILVSAAGILAELTLAALAAIVWIYSSGTLHELALNVMVIGGVSTVFFNSNPLLKFDGYYILADSIEIPNLADRARRHVLELGRTRLLGMPPEAPTIADRAERAWLASYGMLSSVYRVLLMFSIAWMLSGEYFFFGIALAIWVIATSMLLPGYRFLQFLKREGHRARPAAVLVISLSAVALLVTLSALPLPQRTLSTGVVWLPENAIVRLASRCGITHLEAARNTLVEPGTALFDCTNDELTPQWKSLQARISETKARRAGIAVKEPVAFRMLEDELVTLRAELADVEYQRQAQHVVARTAGRFVPADLPSLEGQHFDQGDIAAFVVPARQRTLRVAVEQADIGLLQSGVRDVELLFAEGSGSGRVFSTSIRRRTPRATHAVPTPALTTVGGGALATDDAGQSVREAIFDVELDWPEAAPAASIGSHVTVRFVHEPAPLLGRLVTRVRRALSTRLAV